MACGGGLGWETILEWWKINGFLCLTLSRFDLPTLPDGFYVSKLRHHDNSWDTKFIKQLFGGDMAKKEHDDVLIWHYTKYGEYTVKSEYKTCFMLEKVAGTSNKNVMPL